MSKISGSCLCGSIRYRSDAEPEFIAVCHCKGCQKSSGSAFAVLIGVDKESVIVEKGQLSTYETHPQEGVTVRRSFCGSCGSPIFSEPSRDPDIILVKSGTLDDASWVQPEGHVWWVTAQPWVKENKDLPIYERGYTEST